MNAYRWFLAAAIQTLLLSLCACGGQTSVTPQSQLPPVSSTVPGVSGQNSTSGSPAYNSFSRAPVYSETSRLRGHLRSSLPKAPASVPLVIPVWGVGGDGPDKDPGAVADQHLFAAILDNSAVSSSSLARNCPGVSSHSTCQPYKYVNFSHNLCYTSITLAACIASLTAATKTRYSTRIQARNPKPIASATTPRAVNAAQVIRTRTCA